MAAKARKKGSAPRPARSGSSTPADAPRALADSDSADGLLAPQGTPLPSEGQTTLRVLESAMEGTSDARAGSARRGEGQRNASLEEHLRALLAARQAPATPFANLPPHERSRLLREHAIARLLGPEFGSDPATAINPEVLVLQDELTALRKKHGETQAEFSRLINRLENGAERNAPLTDQLGWLITQLEQQRRDSEEKQGLIDILNSVGGQAQQRLLQDPLLVSQFHGERAAFVMSVDIRRSTELMLKATEPSKFAEFISVLGDELRAIVWENFGVFDKFTGDGILAFFPEFYTGPDAGYLTVRAASQCHLRFEEIYAAFRHCFDTVLLDAGLGIGIDYGTPCIVRQWGSVTVVGKPVVYACRLGGARAGETLLNQRAYGRLQEKYDDALEIQPSSVTIAHEGTVLAYQVRLRSKAFPFTRPDWVNA